MIEYFNKVFFLLFYRDHDYDEYETKIRGSFAPVLKHFDIRFSSKHGIAKAP